MSKGIGVPHDRFKCLTYFQLSFRENKYISKENLEFKYIKFLLI